ncbi:uncharacterized protein LOC117340784 [Pecten maximus]|uniref:uncharacterized protein LOC117340784 n=1 Tax=Pecten maximus TaxID=6579 RepID=UPI001458F34F|nr:uncharacterized protein LOC117340784 [Pecten maximus]
MDVPFLFSILVTLHISGVMSMTPMMQGMNADIMKDIMNLRRKIKNHQKTLSNKGTAKESNSILPAAEIAMREFFTNDGKTPASTKTSDKKKSSKKDTTRKNVKIPDVPATLKNVEASHTNTVPVEKKANNAMKSKKLSKKTSETKTKDQTPQEKITGPSDQQSSSKSDTTGATVAKTTAKSTSTSTRRSRRRSSRRRKSSRKSKQNTTPSPRTTTQANPAAAAPTVPKATAIDTTPPAAAAQAPGQSMRTTMTHLFSEGPMLMASMLAQVYPQLVRLLGGARSQRPMMDPNMAVMMHEEPYFNQPTIQGDGFGQVHTANPSRPGQQRSTKKSSSTSKTVQAGTNPMQIYMQRELCSETPSRFIRMCKTTMDCKHKMKCYSGYCCARSHRHAEMLDNLPEYIDMPRPQRSWRSFFK